MTSDLQALSPSGEPLEDETLVTIEVHLPAELYAELQREVEEGQHSADSLVGAALTTYLATLSLFNNPLLQTDYCWLESLLGSLPRPAGAGVPEVVSAESQPGG